MVGPDDRQSRRLGEIGRPARTRRRRRPRTRRPRPSSRVAPAGVDLAAEAEPEHGLHPHQRQADQADRPRQHAADAAVGDHHHRERHREAERPREPLGLRRDPVRRASPSVSARATAPTGLYRRPSVSRSRNSTKKHGRDDLQRHVAAGRSRRSEGHRAEHHRQAGGGADLVLVEDGGVQLDAVDGDGGDPLRGGDRHVSPRPGLAPSTRQASHFRRIGECDFHRPSPPCSPRPASLHQPHGESAAAEVAGAGHQPEDARDVAARLRVRRDAHARGHGARAGVVGGQRERDRAELRAAGRASGGAWASIAAAASNGSSQADAARGAGHELRDALRARPG